MKYHPSIFKYPITSWQCSPDGPSALDTGFHHACCDNLRRGRGSNCSALTATQCSKFKCIWHSSIYFFRVDLQIRSSYAEVICVPGTSATFQENVGNQLWISTQSHRFSTRLLAGHLTAGTFSRGIKGVAKECIWKGLQVYKEVFLFFSLHTPSIKLLQNRAKYMKGHINTIHSQPHWSSCRSDSIKSIRTPVNFLEQEFHTFDDFFQNR